MDYVPEDRQLATYGNYGIEHEHDECTSDSYHQLIIIGNGFDLECGLRSSYSDFEKTRAALLNLQENSTQDASEWADSLINQGITVWDVILERWQTVLWSNVEKAIEFCLVGGEDSGCKIKGSQYEPPAKCWARKIEKGWSIEGGVGDQGEDLEWLVLLFLVKKSGGKEFSEKKVFEILLNQLCELENAFQEYLFDQEYGNTEYFKNADILLHQIMRYEDPDGRRYCLNGCSSLLNFNYTDPTGLGDNHEQCITDAVINVHGRIGEGSVLFGIDGRDCAPEVLPFTKAYRVLRQQRENMRMLYRTASRVVNDRGPTNVIKFYGHSLSDVDYSYFQAIFDGVDLYSGKTKLVFLYRAPRNNDGSRSNVSEAKGSVVGSVVKLVNKYGSTFDNVEHGRNLLSKLIVEGRIQISQLPESD